MGWWLFGSGGNFGVAVVMLVGNVEMKRCDVRWMSKLRSLTMRGNEEYDSRDVSILVCVVCRELAMVFAVVRRLVVPSQSFDTPPFRTTVKEAANRKIEAQTKTDKESQQSSSNSHQY